MSEPATPEERAQHAVRLKMADDKWAELVANEHYENAGLGHHWYWSQGFIWGMRAAEPEINMMREAICRLADQDATLSVCNGNVTVDCSTEVKLELTDEQRVVLAAAIERDKKNGVMLVPGPPALTDAEREAIEQSADLAAWDSEYFADTNKSLADGAAKRLATLRGLLERMGGGR